MKRFINFGCLINLVFARQEFDAKTEKTMQVTTETERVTWFSMWFMASIATFGATFFPMFYRVIDSRNKHFRREADLEKKIAGFLKKHGKELPATFNSPGEMKAKAWAGSIILVIPAVVILYYLSKDLCIHEEHEEKFLAIAFPQKIFMTQTIPIKKYALITVVTLGVGGVYWLYKIINLYNAHFKAQWKVEKEIARLMEEENVDEFV